MNKHIELVKKWLADKDSVSKEELKANRDAAYAAATAEFADAEFAAYAAAYDAVAYDAAYDAAYWVARYEELIDEQRE